MALKIITVSYHVHFNVWNRTHILPLFLQHSYRKVNTKSECGKRKKGIVKKKGDRTAEQFRATIKMHMTQTRSNLPGG
jgi:hypothetical protein